MLDLEGSQTNDGDWYSNVRWKSRIDDHPKPEPVCQFKPFFFSFLPSTIETGKKAIQGGVVKL